MRRFLCVSLVCTLSAAAVFAQRNAREGGCIGSVSVSSFRLSVQPAAGAGATALPIRRVNNLAAGSRISYRPIDLPSDLKKDAKLTLVLVPQASDGQVTVLEPQLAAAAGEWRIPFPARILLLVFAPQGLDEKRLTNLVTRDEALVATLADYADETADLESQIEVATELQQDAEDDDAQAARPTTPAEQALFALVRAINPAVSGYDPLGVGRRVGPTTMGKGEEAFFDNAGGIVPGGGILPMVKTWLMPDTEFRSVYTVPVEMGGMALCTKVQTRGKNKLAYLWAYRLAGGDPPMVAAVKSATDLPIGLRDGLPVKLGAAAWASASRIFDWSLVPASGAPVAVSVRPVPDERALRLDLRKFAGAPGAYQLQGKWDWGTVRVAGSLRLHKLDDFKTARLTPESQDKLIAGTGPVPVELTGADFLFADHAWLHRAGSARQTPAEIMQRTGAADGLPVEIETDGLRPGPYLLTLARVDGATSDLPVRLLAAPPRLDGPAPRVNLGDAQQRMTLVGSGLDRIQSLTSSAADLALETVSADATHRDVTVRLHAGARAGDRLDLAAKVDGMATALRFPGALQVAAARPRVVEAKASLPGDLTVAPREGEIPAGSWIGFALRSEPANAAASLTLQCAEARNTVQTVKLRLGEKQPNAQWTASDGGASFLSVDPGSVGQSGCTLTAVMDVDELGKSDPFTLGKVVRLPRIESFAMTDEKAANGFYGTLKGFDLETIEKTGWDANNGIAAPELPKPLAGEGAKQTLRIAMPWPSPSPKAPLFVWLRGETSGRATTVRP